MDMLTDNFDKTRRYYRVDIYNRYVDIAFAHADLDEFDIDELLSHPNPKVRDFSFILISRNIEKDGNIISKPIIAIYDKNIWKSRFYLTKERLNFKFNFHTEYSCVHHMEQFDNNILINVPCNNQEGILDKFNTISKLLIKKDKVKKKTLSKDN